ncbi:GPR endopeptidase [Butyricicoccus sp. TM10-16AC]|mgnify:FL=1|jgi:spore protease|uniref:GPR endopeptidase n=1 Tax=Butyricicoccus sp. AF35-5AC TaxID=2292003 RepID=UPI000E5090DF|nr:MULTISPECIES: GPR endopeptidase [unclassified Butyricicoccus]RHP16695.1 GPR endopeptidase [Butyricicoccus sp. AF35-5AC]RHU20464.1 GPR endopeptidase [Butyricicoccus sp. TM10-16AC]
MAFRTDLAVEAIENHKTAAALPHVRQSDRTLEGFAVHEVRILSEDAAREIGKPQGRYLTLELDALIRREEDAFPRACKALSTLLRELLPRPNDGAVLIAGLGNRMITPDAIGPQTADHVIATRHLVAQSPAIFADWRPVSALAPGVLGQTGVETGEVICGVLDRVRPAAVIAVDALAAGRLSRLLRTVQLADTGITPGAGVGNARAALNKETLGVPVIAVGVPTVVDGATLAHEISSQLGQPDCEALDDLSQPVMITTRDIDREVADISRMIGYAVNMALHPHLSVADIDLYLS